MGPNIKLTISRTVPEHVHIRSQVRIAFVNYPDKEVLNSIYSCLMSAVLSSKCQGSATWASPQAAKKLAACTVDVFEQVFERI